MWGLRAEAGITLVGSFKGWEWLGERRQGLGVVFLLLSHASGKPGLASRAKEDGYLQGRGGRKTMLLPSLSPWMAPSCPPPLPHTLNQESTMALGPHPTWL